MIELRPHHILCFQSYIGKGYSSDFTDNMDYIVSKLRKNPKEKLRLVDGLDHICGPCPKNMGVKCEDQEKVLHIDSQVMENLGLDFGVYSYEYLVDTLYRKLSKTKFDKICSTCQWYKQGMCKNILRKKLKD